jgi:hypothetical protein
MVGGRVDTPRSGPRLAASLRILFFVVHIEVGCSGDGSIPLWVGRGRGGLTPNTVIDHPQ